MAIAPHLIEQVRQAVDIVDVINSYVPLKRAGANYKALSPFNKEKTPSFFVSPQRQTFKCFSSGHGGDVFKFLMLYESIDFPTAIRRLAEKAGIRIEEDKSGNYDREKQSRDRLLTLHSEVAAYWREILLHESQAEPARAYMQGREMPQSWVSEFGLGYAPSSWDDTLRWGGGRGFDEGLLLQAGLVVRNESGRVYDRFRGRLVFPIRNDQGQVIAFSARLLEAEVKAAKYINSPETPIFTKSRVLFGLERAKRPILEAGRVVVCEGQIDVLRCHAAGILHVVAPLGTAFTPEHARILKRYTQRVVLCLDADRAGLAAAERVADILLDQSDPGQSKVQSELGVEVVRLPAGEDPDSLILKEGVEAFQKRLAQPLEYIDFYLERIKEMHDDGSIAGRRQVIEKAAAFLARISNLAYREQLAYRAIQKLNVSEAVLLERVEALARDGKKTGPNLKEQAPVVQAEVLQPHPLVAGLLQILVAQPQLVPELQRVLDPVWVRDLPGEELLLKLVEIYNDEGWHDVVDVLPQLGDGEQNYLAGLSLEELKSRSGGDCLKGLGQLLGKLQFEHVQARIKVVTRQLAGHDLQVSRKRELMAELTRLSRLKNSLTSAT